MGREIKDQPSETERQREELRLLYRGAILDLAQSERQEAYKTLTDPCLRFLSAADPASRLDAAVADVIRRSARSEARPWLPGQTAEVLRYMETYALNLWDHPWKTEFRTIKMFSGFFKIKIENRICNPEDILLLLGYKKVVNSFQLLQMQSREEVGRVAFALFLASLECSEMEKIHSAVKPIGIGSRLVFDVRQEVLGDVRACADQVRERYRQCKAGGGGGGGGGRNASSSKGAPSQPQDPGSTPERSEDAPGSAASEYSEVAAVKNRSGTMTGLPEDGRTNRERRDASVGHPNEGHSTFPGSSHAGKLDPRVTMEAVKTLGSFVPTEKWHAESGARAMEAPDSIYDAVEDLPPHGGESLYYGFPSAEKGQLGTLKSSAKPEKKEPLASRVTGGNSMWNQPVDYQSKMSFSTFRQDKTKNFTGGGEFKDPTSRKSTFHTIDSHNPNPRETGGQRGRGTHALKGIDAGDYPCLIHVYGGDAAKSRGSGTLRSPAGRQDVSPYQPWLQFQNADLPPPPAPEDSSSSAYPDLQSRRSAAGLRGSGKTRDPWESEDVIQDEGWQCGSCGYENLSLDDACHDCGTSRFL